jgi:hypothetical protein
MKKPHGNTGKRNNPLGRPKGATPTKSITIRVDIETYKALALMAKEQGVTVSTVARRIVINPMVAFE